MNKSIRSVLITSTIVVNSVVGLYLLRAQETSSVLEQDASSLSDTEVLLQAVRAVPPLPMDEQTNGSTYYSAQHYPGTEEEWPPLPGNPNGLDAWDMGNGSYLLDDFNYDWKHHRMLSSGGMMMAMSVPSPVGEDDEGDTNFSYPMLSGMIPIDTNGLWLEITNVFNGYSYFNLHNATDYVYAIWTTTNVATRMTNWDMELELFPADTNSQPFTLQNNNRNPLFVRAQDWASVDSNSDGVPDWWIWLYYGNLSENATNVDLSGNTLGYDYSNNIVPLTFEFNSISVADNHVHSTSPSAQLDVTGNPYYIAISVDPPSPGYGGAGANWQLYASPTINLPLGTTEGWHEVWVGLLGRGNGVTNAVWQWKRLKLDMTPPQIVITNPVVSTVDKPIIQLQGYANEALSSISYDLTNAVGTVSNQLVLVEDQSYDTNTFEFTTNWFQAYDVPLTNGLNTITIHATDLAGNTTTTNFNFTLDYSAKTNPPVVNLLWPQDGMAIVGSNIVCRGQVSDDTATVNIELIDASGNTNNAGSLVGRDGNFYSDDLTLASGTNYLNYTVTDAAGNVATTNITVTTSSLGLTLDTVVAGQTQITGTIDDTNYVVYVNGVEASQTNGTWSATITPIGIGGGAVVVNAVNGGDPTLQQIVDPPQGVFMSSYHEMDYTEQYAAEDVGNTNPGVFVERWDWTDRMGGAHVIEEGLPAQGMMDTDIYRWPATAWPQALPGYNVETRDGEVTTNAEGLPVFAMEHYHGKTPMTYYHDAPNDIKSWSENSKDTEMKLATGGKKGSRLKNLWGISVTATDSDTGQPIPPQQITIQGKTLLTNGVIYLIFPDDKTEDITPKVNGNDHYTFSVSATEYHSYFEVFVEPSSIWPLETGHAFWRFSTEAPNDALQYISIDLTIFLNQCKGFYPSNDTSTALLGPPGKLQNDDETVAYMTRKFYIGFPDLLNGLEFTRGVAQSPPGYTLFVYDCIDCALDAGGHANVRFTPQPPLPMAPTDFAWYLSFVFPGPWLNNPTIFYP